MKLKDVLDIIAFIFTIFLVTYGFAKGYDLVELSIYNIYFIDIIIFVDDATIQWDDELIAWYREELQKIVANNKNRDKLHINTVTLTVFWDEFKSGEPVAINIVRYGKALIDFGGFFEPLKILLAKGKIKPSAEAVYNALRRAPFHLSRAKYGLYL